MRNDKATLRARLRQARRAAGGADAAADGAIVARLHALPEVAAAQSLALYRAQPGEPDLAALVAAACAAGITIYLPVVVQRASSLQFARYEPGQSLDRGPFGLEQPDGDAPRIAPAALDVAVLPALGLDRDGNRLGHGAGYYDITFAAVPRPTLIGVVYSFALVEHIEPDAWDVPVEVVVTPELTVRTGRGTRATPR